MNPDQDPPRSLAEAVREHLALLLNTRQGSVSHLPDYGMPDLSGFYKGFPDSLKQLGESIHETVSRYEPRIADLQVNLASSSDSYFEAVFEIVGYLDAPGQPEHKVEFKTVISGSGFTKVGM